MFTEPVLLRKNNVEIRNRLEQLGYHRIENGVNEWRVDIEECIYLTTDVSVEDAYMGEMGRWNQYSIDCGTNEELFFALAALRDDTDKHQWFVCDKIKKDTVLDRVGKFFIWEFGFNANEGDMLGTYYHKATPEEIIEHFTKTND